MNNEHLKTFITVADQKSFSEAARILYLSQPTITAQIKSLESAIQASLFERTKKYVKLTQTAKALYPYAKRILDTQVQAQNEIDQLMGEVHGQLMVVSSLTVGESILPTLLNEFKTRFPLVELSTEILNSRHIVEMVKNEEVEIGLIEAELDEPTLEMEAFMNDELVLVARKGYFKEAPKQVTINQLRNTPIVFREKGSGTRTVIHQYLQHQGIAPEELEIALELGSTESVKAAVEAGLGVSILSRHTIRKELALGLFEVFPIEQVKLKRHFYFVYKKQNELTLISKHFLDLIRKKGTFFPIMEKQQAKPIGL